MYTKSQMNLKNALDRINALNVYNDIITKK